MLETAIAAGSLFYRVLTPQWAYAPESGAGAAKAGARFDRPGVEVLYLAQTPEAAMSEYQRGASRFKPCTVTSFEVAAARIVDFREGYRSPAFGVEWAHAFCNWERIAFIDNLEPPSWLLGDLILKEGFDGLLYPSQKHRGAICLALFRNGPAHSVKAIDPDALLPRNRMSWSST